MVSARGLVRDIMHAAHELISPLHPSLPLHATGAYKADAQTQSEPEFLLPEPQATRKSSLTRRTSTPERLAEEWEEEQELGEGEGGVPIASMKKRVTWDVNLNRVKFLPHGEEVGGPIPVSLLQAPSRVASMTMGRCLLPPRGGGGSVPVFEAPCSSLNPMP
jgi:hypothetical protein